MNESAIVRIKDVPNILGVSLSTVRRLIDSGTLKPIKLIARARGFTRDQLSQYLNSLQKS